MLVSVDSATCPSELQSARDESSPAPRALSEQVTSSRPWSTNSAAVSFLDEAFQHHDIDTPEEADTSAFAATEWISRGTHEAIREAGASIASLPRPLSQQRIRSISRQHGAMSAAQRDFLSILPPTAPMALLVIGFPLSIVDEDCNVDVPEQYPLRSKDASWESIRWKSTGKATVLSYKVSMAQLSVIVKRALSELYGNRKQTNSNELGARTEGPLVQRLINTVTSLDQQIRQWHDHLPQELCLKEGDQLQQDARPANWAGGSNHSLSPEHHQHTFRIQALALKLAAMKKINTAEGSDFRSIGENDPLQSSVRSCRDAALQIANIGCTPHFKEVIDTYALSFVALHLFTAGVTLSIMTGLDPLSREAYDSKMGLRKLMEMHSQLKSKSVVAEQGLNILTKLMKLVMTKEMERMLHLDVPPQTESDQNERENESSGSSNAIEVTARGTEITTIGPSSNIDQNALQQRTPAADVADNANATLSFSEDPIITQALSEFEQSKGKALHDSSELTSVLVMMYDVNGVGEGDPVEFSEYLTESCFGRQDQGWIWNQAKNWIVRLTQTVARSIDTVLKVLEPSGSHTPYQPAHRRGSSAHRFDVELNKSDRILMYTKGFWFIQESMSSTGIMVCRVDFLEDRGVHLPTGV
ncbi:tall aerial hyphae-4 [Colletotrichum salicis]|uniref:Tall aerial hyphae-4 n=1 Tax=Colletotrichum salicis TaxID=1209931 RepID=A0A135U8N8_9PEZI|nr:tall aerial hyphae-4 [Colletotrichum salicis]